MPFRYEKAPLLIDNAGKSDFPQLQHLIDPFDRSTWEGRFSSGFRTRRRPLRPEVAREIIRVFDQRIKHAGSDDIATQYQDAMAKPPPKIDTHRKATYRKYLAAAKSRKRQVAGSSSRC